MNTLIRFAAVFALAISLPAGEARAQARDMAFDFRMTDSGTMAPKTGVSTGRALVSKGRVRMDVKGSARSLVMPGAVPGDAITMIILDHGKTVIYLNPKTKQYLQFSPVEVMDRMQKMIESMGATMRVEFTGDPNVQNVGPGPVILGYKTRHYRITTSMKTTMSMMGDSQTSEVSAVTDEYLAPDLKNMLDPFRDMSSSSIGIMGSGNKAYLGRLMAAQARLPKAMELRAETRVTVNAGGQTQSMMSVREITAIQNTKASDAQFSVPSAYTRIDVPLGPGRGRIPPE